MISWFLITVRQKVQPKILDDILHILIILQKLKTNKQTNTKTSH